MTHILMAHTGDGILAMAKPVIAHDEEELTKHQEQFVNESVHAGVGDTVSMLTEEELVLIQNLNVNEVYDAGI